MEESALLGDIYVTTYIYIHVISYYGALCHDMSYVTTIVAFLIMSGDKNNKIVLVPRIQ